VDKFESAFSEILNILSLDKNKEQDVPRFLSICSQKTTLTILENLSKEREDALRKKMVNQTNPDKIAIILAQEVSINEFEGLFKTVFINEVKNFVNKTSLNLSREKKEEIDAVLINLSSSS
jgi:hypothetical protein